ncbi:uncharacterized protein si:ch211-214p13.8 [Girardinichthys multiradiatus]|uniref:uncharacterized protein si:ch211-214p13.8 n=1 Tax=Girardinichthys multiradiatus TaxID=208333 RepID=UPI001FAC3AC3|nr:uncharacterized protein si:ch211-214p13.8 [Girardinichthys multiradiatus]
MENIEISQKQDQNKLISYLSFTQVSIKDDGLYRCDLGFNHNSVGHVINISVSDLNEGIENSDNFAVDSNTSSDDYPWLPYFTICSSIVLLVTIVIVLTLVCFHGWKGTWTSNNRKQEEISTHTIPELPKTSVLFSPTVRTQSSVLNDVNSSRKVERTTSTSPPPAHIGNQPAVANTAAKTQVSNSVLYAVINYQQGGRADRRSACKQGEKINDAVVNVN